MLGPIGQTASWEPASTLYTVAGSALLLLALFLLVILLLAWRRRKKKQTEKTTKTYLKTLQTFQDDLDPDSLTIN
jgi:cbb3-type cytochrome oxidase subunit 3